jgi:hypothetical protein
MEKNQNSKFKATSNDGFKFLESGDYDKGFKILLNFITNLQPNEISKLLQLLPLLIKEKKKGDSFREPFLLLSKQKLTEKDEQNIVEFILSNQPMLLSNSGTILSILKFKTIDKEKYIFHLLPFFVKCIDFNEEKVNRRQDSEAVKKVLADLLDDYLSKFKNAHVFAKFIVLKSFIKLELKFSEDFNGIISMYLELEDLREEIENIVVNMNAKKFLKGYLYILYVKKIVEFNNQYSICVLKNHIKMF